MGALEKFEKDIMANRHKNLVHYVTNKFITKFPILLTDQDELICVGNSGFTKALETFDTSKGAKFSTYAYTCIHNEVMGYVRNEGRKNKNTISLSTTLSTDKNGHILEVEDTISFEELIDEQTVDKGLIRQERKERVLEGVKILTPKQQSVIIKRFGLDGSEPMTQVEVAKAVGMSQANVSKIESDALERLAFLLSPLADEY